MSPTKSPYDATWDLLKTMAAAEGEWSGEFVRLAVNNAYRAGVTDVLFELPIRAAFDEETE